MDDRDLLNSSILNDVKKIIGISDMNPDFDTDIVLAINANLVAFRQMGFGKENFAVVDQTETWNDLLQDDELDLHNVKIWLAFKTKMMFDPPASGAYAESMKAAIAECEWRFFITKNYVGEVEEAWKNYGT